MLCSVCKEREATVHLTQIAGEEMQKVDLCEECAKAKGVNDPEAFSFADLVLGLGASQAVAKGAGRKEAGCPCCGFTQADFKKTGRLGCPDCYEYFSEGLESLLKSMHKGIRHVGKVPKRYRRLQKASEATDKIKTLQRKLGEAIEAEQFEQAAELRDEIRALTSKAGEPTSDA